MDGFPFDARHTFKINHFTDIERYAELDETYVEPKAEEYQPRVCLPFTQQPLIFISSVGTSQSVAGRSSRS